VNKCFPGFIWKTLFKELPIFPFRGPRGHLWVSLCYPSDPVSVPLDPKLSLKILFYLPWYFPLLPSLNVEGEHDAPGESGCCFSSVDKYWLSRSWGEGDIPPLNCIERVGSAVELFRV
jgi:hypothetical protein